MRWRHAVRATFTPTTATDSSSLPGKVICNSRATQIAHEMLVEYFMALLVIMGLTATVDKQSRHSSQYFGHLAAAEELSNLIPDNYEGPDPIFDNSTEREIIAALGTTARLHCRVRNLGDRAVSWIRQRDLHILTIGIMTYTNDQRFLARHIDNSDEWVLKIVSVQPRDAGIYECQVSTEPKISLAYKLIVVTSKAQILANRELFIQSGSDINLTCIAPQAPGPYTHMLWHKDTELVSDSARGGIRVVSEQQMKTSNLVISRVLNTDSGNYTCSAENSNSDSVFVHIIKSEQHAAMQHELGARLELPPLPLLLLAALLVVLAPLAPLAASPVFLPSSPAAALAASPTHPVPL